MRIGDFMEWIITSAILGTGILLLGIFTFINNKKNNEKISEHLLQVAEKNNMIFSIASKGEHDYIIEDENKVVYIKKLIIPHNSSVTINARNTWCLRWGGKRMGRSYPNKRYINELIPYLMADFASEKKIFKMVIIYPNTEVILKYLNESELATVNPMDNNYGMQVLRFSDIEANFATIVKQEKK